MQTIVHSCPHCAQQYMLEPSYLAQYGGQTTVCTQCRQSFVLPTAQTVAPAFQNPAQGQAAYGQPGYGQPAYGQPQYAAGYPQAPAGQPVLGYATPQFAPTTSAVWREGKLVVAGDMSRLPHSCVKCGQPAAGQPYRRVYYWHNPGYYLLILFPGLLIYAIVALCVRSKGTVYISLCDRHRSARVRNLIISWVVLVSSIGFWMLAAETRDRDLEPLLVIGGFLALVGGLIAVLFSSRMLYPKRIERGYLWLAGAGEGFLSQLTPTGR